MQLTNRLARLAFTSAAVVALAASGFAQGPVANGAGMTRTGESHRAFSFTAVRMPDGEIRGQAHVHVQVPGGAVAFILIDVTSVAYDAQGDLLVGGPITTSVNSPDVVGLNAFFSVRDNDPGGSTDTITNVIWFNENPFPDAQSLADALEFGSPFGTWEAFLNANGLGFNEIAGGNVTIH